MRFLTQELHNRIVGKNRSLSSLTHSCIKSLIPMGGWVGGWVGGGEGLMSRFMVVFE